MKNLFIIMGIFCFAPLRSQLNVQHNQYRAGDVLVKQQVEYVDPDEAGADRLWNFSKLKIINDAYILEYALPPLEGDSVYILGNRRYKKKDVKENELIVGTEHNTMYYYHLNEDTLLQIGHENPYVLLAYTSPMAILRFPLNYAQTISSNYRSKNLYSRTVNIQTEGTFTTTADAYGKIILPSKDTLDFVLRVKTLQTIVDIPKESGDTSKVRNRSRQLEIYRWYSKGYRYPVFETIRNLNLADSSVISSTAFFFPPQDHLYLDTDSANLALLDQLWNLDKQNIKDSDRQQSETVSLQDIMTCKLYPNPVSSILNLDYELKQDAKVSFQLFTTDGTLLKTTGLNQKKMGVWHETIDCSHLATRNYILVIIANGLSMNEVIVKK